MRTVFRACSLTAAFLAIFVIGSIAHATPAPSVNSMEALRRIVSDGLASGQKRIVIPPGIYKGGPLPGKGEHLSIVGAKNITIVADGVSMICTDYTRAITMANCADVTITGLMIDYDPLPFTQGDVVAVNPGEGWVDIKVHAGYPYIAASRIDICDRATRYRKRDKPFMWDSKAELRGDGIVRIHCKEAAAFAKVGDLASLGGVGRPVVAHTLDIANSARVTLNGVSVFSSNCMGIIASGGDGDHRFLKCRVIPGPPPAGATEARILSTDADAILTGPMKKGVLTEGCEIRDAGDDSWSVQSEDYVILKIDGNTLTLSPRGQTAPEVGDRIQAELDGPIWIVRDVQKVPRDQAGIEASILDKLVNAKPWTFWRLRSTENDIPVVVVKISGTSLWPVGTSLRDIDRQGDGFNFRRNKVQSSGRILIKAAGIVEDNVIDSPFAICANPEVPTGAAIVIPSLIIRNNRITDAHSFNPMAWASQAGAISVTSADSITHGFRPAGSYGKVVIEGNTIEGGNGSSIDVTSAKSVVIRGNRIDNPQAIEPNDTGGHYNMDNHAIIWLSDIENVQLIGNKLIDPGKYMNQPVVSAANVGKLNGSLVPERK